MELANVIALVTLGLAFVGMIAYVSARFSKNESEIEHLKNHYEDLKIIRDMVYRIHAQNEILFSIKQTPLPT